MVHPRPNVTASLRWAVQAECSQKGWSAISAIHAGLVWAGGRSVHLTVHIHGNGVRHLGVGKINDLNGFRALMPGTRILFPLWPGPTP